MNTKSVIWIGLFVGSAIGGWIPSIWDAGFLSFSSIIGSTIGGIAGIYAGFKISHL